MFHNNFRFSNQSCPIAKGYCRVSTNMQAFDGASIETQQERIKNYCQFKGYKLENFYIDNGLSGKNTNRPGLQNLLKDLKSGDHIIINDLSRLSRNTYDALGLLAEFDTKGAFLICISPELDLSSHFGRVIFTILMSFYHLERANISANVSNNMQRLSSEGKLRTKPPFGFKFVDKSKDLEPVPEQQQVIEKIKHLYLSGMKVAQIVKKLNDDGDNLTLNLNKKSINETPRFYPQSVKRILVDHGLIEPEGSYANRKPLNQRIISHHKNEISLEDSTSLLNSLQISS